jgi:hypothetical protein
VNYLKISIRNYYAANLSIAFGKTQDDYFKAVEALLIYVPKAIDKLAA